MTAAGKEAETAHPVHDDFDFLMKYLVLFY